MQKKGFGLIVALGLSVLPATAGSVTYPPPGDTHPVNYTCDPSIGAALCDQLNHTLGTEYASIFTNASANIYITMGSLGNNVLAHNEEYYTTVYYADYYNALKASIHGAADASAVASLPEPPPGVAGLFSNPINSGYQVSLTSALDAALGFSGTYAPRLQCLAGISTCFNGIITLSNASNQFDFSDSDGSSNGKYDFFTVVQHETDEVLGTGSCVQAGTLKMASWCDNGFWGVSAADLFRYVAPGQRGFSIDALGKVTFLPKSPYFSTDGGATGIAGMSTSPIGDDYGDLSTQCQHVQDSIGCNAWAAGVNRRGRDLTNDGGVEVAMLDAIGYHLTGYGQQISAASPAADVNIDFAPEPSSIGLVSIGFGLSGVLLRRRQRG